MGFSPKTMSSQKQWGNTTSCATAASRNSKRKGTCQTFLGITCRRQFLTISSVRKALRTYSGTQGVSNFSPAAAAAIYHHLLPEQGGVVFDPSCGWGGRLLGAIACDRVHKYIGCDPSTETYKGLLRMRANSFR